MDDSFLAPQKRSLAGRAGGCGKTPISVPRSTDFLFHRCFKRAAELERCCQRQRLSSRRITARFQRQLREWVPLLETMPFCPPAAPFSRSTDPQCDQSSRAVQPRKCVADQLGYRTRADSAWVEASSYAVFVAVQRLIGNKSQRIQMQRQE